MYKPYKFILKSLASYLLISSSLTVVDATEAKGKKDVSSFTFSNVDDNSDSKNPKKKSFLKKRRRTKEDISVESQIDIDDSQSDYLTNLESSENLKCPKCNSIVKDNPINFISKGTIAKGSFKGNQKFKCKSCNIIFHKDTPDPAEKYLKTIENPETLQCPTCHTKVVENLYDFRKFFVVNGFFTSGPHKGKQKFFCKKCKRNFFEGSPDSPQQTIISLDEHLSTLDYPENLKCPRCFSNNFTLHGFISAGTHKGERRYQCKDCKSHFHAGSCEDFSKFRGNLLPHLQKLNDPDNFKCHRCHTLVKDNLDNFTLKGFVDSGSLKGKQKFFCKKCNYEFYETSSNGNKKPRIFLEQHLEQIENSETLKCPQCNKIVKDNMGDFKIAGHNYSKNNEKLIICLCKSCNKHFYLNPPPKSNYDGIKCPNCLNETNFKKSGSKNGVQRYFCKNCHRDFAPGCQPSSYGKPLPLGLLCPYCDSQKNVVRKGFFDPETKKTPKYYCKECNVYFSKKSSSGIKDSNDVNGESIRIPLRGNLNSSILFNKLACPFCHVSNVVKNSRAGSNVQLYCKNCNKYFKRPIINTLCGNCGMFGRVISTGNNTNPYICTICGESNVTPPNPFQLQGLSIKPESKISQSICDFNYRYGSNDSKYRLEDPFDKVDNFV